MRCLCICSLLLPLLAVAQTTPGFASREQRYRIQPNDIVEIQFRYTPEYNVTATVQPDGYIATQITGDVRVADLTLAEAGQAIAKQAGERLRDPEVTVQLKDFVKPHFVVAGEVSRPGTYDLRGNVGIVQAIAMSGGFKDSAKRTQVILVRSMNDEYSEVKVIDVRRLESAKGIREDLKLKPNDMLVVPRNTIHKIDPYVRTASLGLYGLALMPR